MYELSLSEDIQRKARESTIKVLEKHGNEFTYECVNDMEYIEQCLNETLRRHSPALGTARVAKQNYPIPNTDIVIEKGMTVLIPFSGKWIFAIVCVTMSFESIFAFYRHSFRPRHLSMSGKIRSGSVFAERG